MINSLSNYNSIMPAPAGARKILQIAHPPVLGRSMPQAGSSDITISTSKYGPANGPARQIIQNDFSNPAQVDKPAYELLRFASRSKVQGGALHLSELLSRGNAEYQQDMRQYSTYSFPTKSGEYPPIELSNFNEQKREYEQGFTFQLKTKSGDVINFSYDLYSGYGQTVGEEIKTENGVIYTDIRSTSFRGASMNFNIDGELSQKEQLQLNELSEKLEGITTAYFDKGNFDIRQLDFSQFDTLSDIDITFSAKDKPDFKMHYHDDFFERSISVNTANREIEIIIDKSSIGMTFSAQEQAQAKQAYLSLLQDAGREAKASSGDTNLMSAVFDMGFNNLARKEKENTNDIDRIALQSLNNTVGRGLVALPDFDFSYNSAISRPNAENKPNEYQGFQVSLSLNTIISENTDTGRLDIVQTQHFKLKAAYYEPLDHLKAVDFENQNYKYTQLSRESTQVTRLLVQDGLLESALSEAKHDYKRTTWEYEEGILINKHEIVDSQGQLKDFTELAKVKREQQDKDLLESIIIDPYQKYDDEKQKVAIKDNLLFDYSAFINDKLGLDLLK
ncbi:hypothetical protein [Bermanella sp. R86510]|uniref:hypothetical protein n=1 Tax=unclassified Bermanella TaxID=2627862 RepID=UPI0037C674CF